jgi:hypothetical protein
MWFIVIAARFMNENIEKNLILDCLNFISNLSRSLVVIELNSFSVDHK